MTTTRKPKSKAAKPVEAWGFYGAVRIGAKPTLFPGAVSTLNRAREQLTGGYKIVRVKIVEVRR